MFKEPAHGPAVEGAVKAGGGAALDRDPPIAVMGISAEAIPFKGDPLADQGVVWSLLHHPLTGDEKHPDGLIDLLKHREVGGGFSQ